MTIFFQRVVFSRKYLKKLLLVIALLLCRPAWAESPGKDALAVCQDNIIYAQKILVHLNEYYLEFRKDDCKDGNDKLLFYSIQKNKKVLLREDIELLDFIGITVLNDNAERVYVSLMTGDGHFGVDVYFIDGQKVEKILEVGSASPLSLMMLENDNEVLLIDRNKHFEKRIPNTYDVYEFVGKKFIRHRDVKFDITKSFKK